MSIRGSAEKSFQRTCSTPRGSTVTSTGRIAAEKKAGPGNVGGASSSPPCRGKAAGGVPRPRRERGLDRPPRRHGRAPAPGDRRPPPLAGGGSRFEHPRPARDPLDRLPRGGDRRPGRPAPVPRPTPPPPSPPPP